MGGITIDKGNGMAEYVWVPEDVTKRRPDTERDPWPVGFQLALLVQDGWEAISAVPSPREGEMLVLMRKH